VIYDLLEVCHGSSVITV